MKFSELSIGKEFGLLSTIGERKIVIATKTSNRTYRHNTGLMLEHTTSGNATVYEVNAELPPKRKMMPDKEDISHMTEEKPKRRKRLPSETVKPELNKEHQKTRYKRQTEFAKANGFTSWSALVTALLNGDKKLV